MKKLLLATVIALSSASAFAGSVDMSCAQAQNYYNTHGRITVRTGSGDLVPIYGLVSRNACTGGYTASPYWVHTTDSSSCVLGYRCYDNH